MGEFKSAVSQPWIPDRIQMQILRNKELDGTLLGFVIAASW